jgi:hypothetical protein
LLRRFDAWSIELASAGRRLGGWLGLKS